MRAVLVTRVWVVAGVVLATVVALAGCSDGQTQRGVLTGYLIFDGGALVHGSTSPRGTAGVVTLRGPRVVVTRASDGGLYRVRVSPGEYVATGDADDSNVSCRSRSSVRVYQGRTSTLDVVCDVK